jgi:hypothetical protein
VQQQTMSKSYIIAGLAAVGIGAGIVALSKEKPLIAIAPPVAAAVGIGIVVGTGRKPQNSASEATVILDATAPSFPEPAVEAEEAVIDVRALDTDSLEQGQTIAPEFETFPSQAQPQDRSFESDRSFALNTSTTLADDYSATDEFSSRSFEARAAGEIPADDSESTFFPDSDRYVDAASAFEEFSESPSEKMPLAEPPAFEAFSEISAEAPPSEVPPFAAPSFEAPLSEAQPPDDGTSSDTMLVGEQLAEAMPAFGAFSEISADEITADAGSASDPGSTIESFAAAPDDDSETWLLGSAAEPDTPDSLASRWETIGQGEEPKTLSDLIEAAEAAESAETGPEIAAYAEPEATLEPIALEDRLETIAFKQASPFISDEAETQLYDMAAELSEAEAFADPFPLEPTTEGGEPKTLSELFEAAEVAEATSQEDRSEAIASDWEEPMTANEPETQLLDFAVEDASSVSQSPSEIWDVESGSAEPEPESVSFSNDFRTAFEPEELPSSESAELTFESRVDAMVRESQLFATDDKEPPLSEIFGPSDATTDPGTSSEADLWGSTTASAESETPADSLEILSAPEEPLLAEAEAPSDNLVAAESSPSDMFEPPSEMREFTTEVSHPQETLSDLFNPAPEFEEPLLAEAEPASIELSAAESSTAEAFEPLSDGKELTTEVSHPQDTLSDLFQSAPEFEEPLLAEAEATSIELSAAESTPADPFDSLSDEWELASASGEPETLSDLFGVAPEAQLPLQSEAIDSTSSAPVSSDEGDRFLTDEAFDMSLADDIDELATMAEDVLAEDNLASLFEMADDEAIAVPQDDTAEVGKPEMEIAELETYANNDDGSELNDEISEFLNRASL